MKSGAAAGARRAVRVAGGAAGFARRAAAEGASWCWLDGDSAAPGEPRTSLLGVAAETRLAARGREQEFVRGLGDTTPPDTTPPAGSGEPRRAGFTSGWVVALGYELGVALLGETPAPDGAAPGLALRLDAVLAIDTTAAGPAAAGESGVEGGADGVLGELRADSEAALDAWLTRHGRLLGAPVSGPVGSGSDANEDADADADADTDAGTAPPGPAEHSAAVHWRRDDTEYAAEVAACKRAIRDGEAYVLCLTDTAETTTQVSPLDLFLRLRAGGTALRGGVIATPGRALVSASPERFLSIRGDRVATHPIKGTRPRGADPAEDLALSAELAADPKERAENLMIVDLMRNDLSRVCVPGTVAVDGFLRVETHPHVHQLVSTVTGQLAPGQALPEVLAACFPGGSMTGAPKRRAVQLLAALEAGPRGLYAGCFGWVDRGGDAELAMTIRSVELRSVELRSVELRSAGSGTAGPGGAGSGGAGPGDAGSGDAGSGGAGPGDAGSGGACDWHAFVGAGGGITADSRETFEVAEKHLKAAPILARLAEATGGAPRSPAGT